MPQYAILQSHEPDICPMTNKAVREFSKKAFSSMEDVSKKHGVKVVSYIHLEPAHKAIMLLEAPNAEEARDFLVDMGFMHFMRMEFYLVTPIMDLLKHAEAIPTLYG